MSDERLTRIETKIDKLLENTARHDVTLSYQGERTDRLEEEVKGLVARSNAGHGAWKLITSIAVFAAIIEGFATFWSAFKK